MPNILFASNSISHFPGTEVRNDAWSYDSTRVPYSIWTPPATPAGTPIFDATTSDETWFHFRHGTQQFNSNVQEPICEITDGNGITLMKFFVQDKASVGYYMDFYAGGQTEQQVKYLPIVENRTRTYDIMIKFTDTLAECQVYMNEILILESTFSVIAKEYPRFLLLGGHKGYNDDEGAYYSEIIVADGDTRNARLDLIRPVGAGVYSDWDGSIGTLADDDPTSGMVTTLNDQLQSTILSAYGGANNISNVVQVTTTVRGVNAPTNLQHLIRMSGVDYLTSSFSVPFAKEFQVTDWVQNPATSTPWDASDLVSAEFGFKSLA